MTNKQNNISTPFALYCYLEDNSIYSEVEYEEIGHISVARYYVGEGMIIIKQNEDGKQWCNYIEDARIIVMSRSVSREDFTKLTEYLDENQKTLLYMKCRIQPTLEETTEGKDHKVFTSGCDR